MKPKLIAHRCGTDNYPELTIDAAKHSLSLGADIIEVDVRLTKDNIPVIAHDPDCSRLFGDSRVIKEIEAKKFTGLSYLENSNYRGITFDEYLAAGVKPLLLHIKDKDKDLTPIFEMLKKHNYERDVVLGVVDFSLFELCKQQLPESKILAFMPLVEDLEIALNSKAEFIRLWEPWVSKERIDKIHGANKQVWTMTGAPKSGTAGYTSEEKLKKLLKLNIDGILINEILFAKRFIK